MRDTDLAWAAGIIDGEGCISLYPVSTQTGNSWVMRVLVVNTDPRMVMRLKDIFGAGTIHTTVRPNPKHRTVFRWEACSKKGEAVLKLVLPYLVTKHEQAEVALYSRTLIQQHGKNKGNPNTEELSWLKRQLSDLKRTP